MPVKACSSEGFQGRVAPAETAFGCPRDFLDNRFVYAVISPRARGLSIGINMNPDKRCDFDCAYCEVNRSNPSTQASLDVEAMIPELQRTLSLVRSGRIRDLPAYRTLDSDLLQLRHVAFSGDGEPTLCPRFGDVVQKVVHLRAASGNSFFKLVLITNSTGLDSRPVQESLKYFTREDEIWAKLDAGTQPYMEKVNRSRVPIEKVLSNILLVARKRPVVIQSIFPLINGEEPPAEEIEAYIGRLNELKNAQAQISLVQIYSATRPSAHPEYGHMPLKSLYRICQQIKVATGLKAEVF